MAKPDWFDGAEYRFSNGFGERMAARIRSEASGVFIDLYHDDDEMDEVRSAMVGAGPIGGFGLDLMPAEQSFVRGVAMVAEAMVLARDAQGNAHIARA